MKKDQLLSAFGAATLLEKDRQTIVRALRDVAPDGHERGGEPRWKLSTILKALETPRAGKSQEAGLTEARAELAREQTISISLKNAIARGEVARLSVIQRSAEQVFATFRERILSIPGKIASICEMRSRGEIEEIVRDELYEALDELHDPTAGIDGGGGGSDSGSGDVDESPQGGEGAAEAEPD